MWKSLANLPLAVKILLLLAAFCCIGSLRFNGNQVLVKNKPYDAVYFEAYTSYFRGGEPAVPIRPATNWRFLMPLLASALPFAAATALNLLNLLFLAISLLFLYFTLTGLRLPANKALLGVALFIFSFPVFYYSSIGYVDPGVMLFLSLGVFGITRQLPGLFLIALVTGLAVKETILMLLPFYICYNYAGAKRRTLVTGSLALLTVLTEFLVIVNYAPVSPGQDRTAFWKFSFDAVALNLHRPNTWLSLLLSLGIPGALYLYLCMKLRLQLLQSRLFAASLAGTGAGLLLYVLSWISTVADGRIIWQCYFFMIPAVLVYGNLPQKETTDAVR